MYLQVCMYIFIKTNCSISPMSIPKGIIIIFYQEMDL
jgi:hypothetical protein